MAAESISSGGGPTVKIEQQRDAISARKIEEVIQKGQLGEIIVREAVEWVASDQERAVEETKEKRDTAEISVPREEQEAARTEQAVRTWKEAVENAAWSELEQWLPDGERSIADLLHQLRALTAQLREAIALCSDPQKQAELMLALDQAVFSAIEELMGSSLEQLISFLFQYGSEDSVRAIRTALYELITGTKYQGETSAAQKNSERGTADERESGYIYRGMKNGGIRVLSDDNGGLTTHGTESREEREAVRLQLEAGLRAAGGSASYRKIFSAQDLERADQFAAHMNRRGLPFSAEALSNGDGGLRGVAAGILSLKLQVLSSQPGISLQMSNELKSVIEQFIFYHLIHGEEDTKSGVEAWGNRPKGEVDWVRDFSGMDIIRIHQAIIKEYGHGGDIRNAILSGIRLAAAILKEAKQRLGKEHEERTERKDHDSVRAFLSEWEKRLEAIKKNWEEYLRDMRFLDDLGLDFGAVAQEMSLWGYVEDLGEPGEGESHSASAATAFLWAAALVLCLVGVAAALLNFGGGWIFSLLGIGMILALSIAFHLLKR